MLIMGVVFETSNLNALGNLGILKRKNMSLIINVSTLPVHRDFRK